MRNADALLYLLMSGTVSLSANAWAFETDDIQMISLGLVAMPTIGASASLGAAVHPAFGSTGMALMSAFLTNLMVVKSGPDSTSDSSTPAIRSPEYREALAEFRNEAREVLADPEAIPGPELRALLIAAQARHTLCSGGPAPTDREFLLVLAVLEPRERDLELANSLDRGFAVCGTQR